MKLIIEIPIDGNDFDDGDMELFVEESKDAAGIRLEVGRAISEEESQIVRSLSLSAEYFKARIEE